MIDHRRLGSLGEKMMWRGQAGMLELAASPIFNRRTALDGLCVVGVHGPHSEDELPEFFHDLSCLL